MNKKNYLSPVVEIMNARVEKGFQMSGDSDDPTLNLELEPEEEGNDYDWSSFDWSQGVNAKGGVPELRNPNGYLLLNLAHPLKFAK